MNIMAIDLSVKKFFTHLSSLHPDKANFQADHPSQHAQRQLIYASVTWGKKTGGSGCSHLDCGNCDVVARMSRVMTDSLMLFCHNLCHP